MGRYTLSIWMLLFLGGAALTQAQDAVTLAKCDPPADNDRQSFTIDAASGKSTGKLKYGLGDKVRVVITNKNPFANEYKLTLDVNEIEETALQRFLGAFPFISNIIPENADEGDESDGQPGAAPDATSFVQPEAPNPCEALEALLREIVTKDDDLAQADTVLQNKLTVVVTTYNDLNNRIQPHLKILAQDKVACEILKPKAEDFLKVIDSAAPALSTQEIRGDAARLQAQLSDQRARIRAFETVATPACLQASLVELRNWQNQVFVTTTNLSRAEAKLTEVEAAVKALRTRRQEIEELGSRTEAFYEVHHLQSFDAPTNVVVRLQGRPRTSQKPEDFKDVTKTATLNFGGGAIFSVSAGIAFSQFEDRRYTRVQGFARTSPTAEPAPPVQAIVGLEEDSDWRTTPLVLLHARLWESEIGRFAAHASFGLSAKVENNDTEVEYLVGTSISFAKSWFLTGGFYYGEFERLAGDLYVGAPLPEAVPQPPVTPDHDWKFGLAFSYKIQ